MSARREVYPLLEKFRNWLIGRPYKSHLRWADEMSPRPGPPPVLPESSFVTISANQYHKRDFRRKVAPPVVVDAGQKLIAAEAKDDSLPPAPTVSGIPVPGRPYEWKEV